MELNNNNRIFNARCWTYYNGYFPEHSCYIIYSNLSRSKVFKIRFGYLPGDSLLGLPLDDGSYQYDLFFSINKKYNKWFPSMEDATFLFIVPSLVLLYLHVVNAFTILMTQKRLWLEYVRARQLDSNR